MSLIDDLEAASAAIDKAGYRPTEQFVSKTSVPGEGGQLCHVCDRVAEERRHPCRFEVACSCWNGVPCDGSGRIGRKR